MRRALTGWAVAAVVVGLVVGVDVAGTPGGGAQERAAATTVPVAGATLICPSVTADHRVTVAHLPPAGDAGGGSQVSLQPLPKGAARTVRLPAGTVVTVTGSARGSLAVQANGPAAAGLEVQASSRVDSGAARGIADVRCVRPAADWWFVGASGSVDATDSLVLADADPVPALVDIQLWGEHGPLASPAAQGIVVPARGRTVVRLDTIAPDTRITGLHVVARAGRIGAGLFAVRNGNGEPQGADWLPPAPEPATEAVLPGFLPPYDNAFLYLLAPGDRDATVTLHVLGSRGDFVPTGLDSITVPAGSVRRVDLTGKLGDAAAAVRVVADTPVTAEGMTYGQQASTGIGEMAWTSATPALTGPALANDDRIAHGSSSTLALTAGATPARVRVAALAPSPPKDTTVTVPAGRTVTVDVATVLGFGHRFDGVSVTPLPGSGPVWAARQIHEEGAHGPLTTVLPLVAVVQTVRLPAADPDARAGLG